YRRRPRSGCAGRSSWVHTYHGAPPVSPVDQDQQLTKINSRPRGTPRQLTPGKNPRATRSPTDALARSGLPSQMTRSVLIESEAAGVAFSQTLIRCLADPSP